MYTVEIIVGESKEVTDKNVAGFILRDLDTDKVSYIELERAIELMETNQVGELGVKDGEIVLDAKDWWRKSARTHQLAVFNSNKNFTDFIAEEWTASREEAEAFANGCVLIIVGPAVKIPISGVSSPLMICSNDRDCVSKMTKTIVPMRKRQGANYGEYLLSYKTMSSFISAVVSNDIPAVINTTLLSVDALSLIKERGLKVSKLIKESSADSTLGVKEIFEEISQRTLTKLQSTQKLSVF